MQMMLSPAYKARKQQERRIERDMYRKMYSILYYAIPRALWMIEAGRTQAAIDCLRTADFETVDALLAGKKAQVLFREQIKEAYRGKTV